MNRHVYFVSYTCGLQSHSHAQTYIVRNEPISSYDDVLEVTKEIEDTVGHILGTPVSIINWIPLEYDRRPGKLADDLKKDAGNKVFITEDMAVTPPKLTDLAMKIVLTDEDIARIKSGKTVEFHGGKVTLTYEKKRTFTVKCGKCGYEDKLQNFHTNTCDACGEIECPKCGNKEEI